MDEKQQRTENLEARFEEAAIKIGDLLIGSLEALAAGGKRLGGFHTMTLDRLANLAADERMIRELAVEAAAKGQRMEFG